MKTRTLLCRIACLAAVMASAASLAAQTYSIDWWTVDGGGGASTGAVYAVVGTIAQPDAGALTGGGYAVLGGFWGVVAAVQTAGAPCLDVVRSNAAVTVSWPQPATGWVLQFASSLSSADTRWTEIPPPYQTNGTSTISFAEPSPAGNRFYRLHRP